MENLTMSSYCEALQALGVIIPPPFAKFVHRRKTITHLVDAGKGPFADGLQHSKVLETHFVGGGGMLRLVIY